MTAPLRRDFISATVLVFTAAVLASRSWRKALRENTSGVSSQRLRPSELTLALHNIQNVDDALGAGNVEMELVVYSPRIDLLKSYSPVGKGIAPTLPSGVYVVACKNTMKAQNLVHANTLADIGYVPSGVVELMAKKQVMGCCDQCLYAALAWLLASNRHRCHRAVAA